MKGSAEDSAPAAGATESRARVRPVPAVTRAVAILRLLGKSDDPMGVNQIARELGLIPSTCLHILRILVEEELVAFNPATKRYSVDVGILAIARSVIRRNNFAELAQPFLDSISQRFRITAIGVQIVGLDHMLVVAISRSELPLRLHVDIGSRFPALISATGRCFAAFGDHPWAELERRFHKLRWDHAPTVEQWRREIDAVRRNGYSLDDGDYIRGVSILSVPVIRSNGVMSHAMVVVGVREQVHGLEMDEVIGELRHAAVTVAAQLGPA